MATDLFEASVDVVTFWLEDKKTPEFTPSPVICPDCAHTERMRVLHVNMTQTVECVFQCDHCQSVVHCSEPAA